MSHFKSFRKWPKNQFATVFKVLSKSEDWNRLLKPSDFQILKLKRIWLISIQWFRQRGFDGENLNQKFCKILILLRWSVILSSDVKHIYSEIRKRPLEVRSCKLCTMLLTFSNFLRNYLSMFIYKVKFIRLFD